MSITLQKKKDFLAKAYFAVSDNPDDDVNPYVSVPEFLAATCGDLRWGMSPDVRYRSKYRFSDNFVRVLEIYHVELSFANVMKALKDETAKNAKAVDTWAAQAKFPDA
ncbi:MAG TPA: hypothetical protein VM029_11620 [Opitutaceae bacterium]|nr:hypothetical protein [Opitutaceae bacterium]